MTFRKALAVDIKALPNSQLFQYGLDLEKVNGNTHGSYFGIRLRYDQRDLGAAVLTELDLRTATEEECIALALDYLAKSLRKELNK